MFEDQVKQRLEIEGEGYPVGDLEEGGQLAGALGDALLEELVGLHPVGDVFADADVAVDPALLVADGEGAGPGPTQRAIGPHDPVFLVVAAWPLVADCSDHSLAVVGVDGPQEGVAVGVQVPGGIAGHLFVSRADIKEAVGGHVGDPKDLADILGQLAELLLAGAQIGGPLLHPRLQLVAGLAERLLGLPAGGDVDRGNNCAPVRKGQRRGADAGPDQLAVFLDDAGLDVPNGLLLGGGPAAGEFVGRHFGAVGAEVGALCVVALLQPSLGQVEDRRQGRV